MQYGSISVLSFQAVAFEQSSHLSENVFQAVKTEQDFIMYTDQPFDEEADRMYGFHALTSC